MNRHDQLAAYYHELGDGLPLPAIREHGWPRDEAELKEHSQTIRDAPVLDDAAPADTQYIENVDAEGATGRCMPHVWAVVRTRCDVARPDRIACDDHVLDLELEVGERAPQRGHHCLDARSAGRMAGTVVLMLHDVVGDELIADVQATLAEAFVDQA